jgi:hypothetical protein
MGRPHHLPQNSVSGSKSYRYLGFKTPRGFFWFFSTISVGMGFGFFASVGKQGMAY